MTEPLWLSRNLILRAGAGTGKTHALTTLGLSLAAGIRPGPALAAERIWMLTFTEKAAGEMRARLLVRADGLASAREPGQPDEPELRAAAEAAGVAFPDSRRWATLRDELVACRATTLHGACAALLRELPMSGLATFETWDERQSSEPLRQAAREAVLASPNSAQLLEDLTLDGAGRFAQGLVGLLCSVHRKLAEDGLAAETLVPPVDPDIDLPQAVADWWRTFEAAAVKRPKIRQGLVELQRVWPDSPSWENLWAIWNLLDAVRQAAGPRRSDAVKAAAEAHDDLSAAVCAPRVRAHWEIFRSVLAETQQRYGRMKRRAHALDFADLCNRARDLLRDDVEARRVAKARVGALLLDESQDTNRVQMDLCLLLAEERGQERVIAPGAALDEVLALEPALFCAVGDRKQSIYGFRGADVSVVERLRRAVLRSGGEERVLDVCRRSRPELLDFFHGLFPQVLKNEGADYEVAFDPGVDALLPFREPLGQPAVELLMLPPSPDGKRQRAETLRLVESEALADRAVELLRALPGRLPGLRDDGQLQPGHLAVLFRTATNLALFRAAFEARGIPCAVVGGDGFYDCPEIQDAVALLAACVDPGNQLAALTVLRSPLCGVSDETLARLAFDRDRGGLSLHELVPLPEGIEDEDRHRLGRFDRSFAALRRAARSLGPAHLLAEVEILFDQRARYGSGQAFANLEKLAAICRDWEAQGMSTAEAALRLTRDCKQQPREELAPAVDEKDLSAVRMMTVHQAKGLEFPVVMVPECGSAGREFYPPARHDREKGLGLKIRGPDGDWHWPPSYEAVQEEVLRRERADQARLLYVAATRARELLIFSGEQVHGAGKNNWRALIETAEGMVRRQAADPAGEPAVLEALETAPSRTLAEALQATEPLGPVIPRDLAMPVTAAAELVLCPRRYQLAQLWHVQDPAWGEGREAGKAREEAPGSPESMDVLPNDEGPRQLGSLAHALLERIDLAAAAGDPDAALRDAVALSPRKVPKSVLGEVRAVLSSHLGLEMATLPLSQLQRERPFVLAVGEKPRLVLHGAIDLLCLLPERALVVDYKRGPPADPKDRSVYRTQVEIYALGAHDFTGGHLPLWGGLWFLGEAQRGPRTWRIHGERLAELRDDLSRAAVQVAGRTSLEGVWEGRDIGHCRATQCPFLARCHGAAS
jgi:ATP-dependent exoDNAse (exonuclease V) beta subunit